MLDVKDLKVGFADSEVVHGIDFNVDAGQIIGIIGESGSGKSVSALSIAGLLSENAWCTGKIDFKGENLNELSEDKRRALKGSEISMIFQEPLTSLNPVLKVGGQIEEPLIIHSDMSSAERRKKVLSTMEAVGLNEPEKLINMYPHELSGGMRQRAMIAMALICDPSLIIADEPTTALDVTLQGQILELLKTEVKKRHMACLFISHNMSIVRNFCDRVYVMHEGVFVESGTPEEIFNSPKDDYTKNLISSIPNGVPRKDAVKENSGKVLEVSDFSVYYKAKKKHVYDKTEMVQVVKNVSFSVREGEMLGLVGMSGCGKTSLSRGILGLQRYTEGAVKLYADGESVDLLEPKTKKCGLVQMIFQDPYSSLNPSKTIGWILSEPLRCAGPLRPCGPQSRRAKALRHTLLTGEALNDAARVERVRNILEDVGLSSDMADRLPSELSGGQRQRVCIALALIQGARLIIADEPVSALDVTVQKQILDLLKDIQKRTGISCIFISHDMDIVRQMCHRVFAMRDGTLEEVNL